MTSVPLSTEVLHSLAEHLMRAWGEKKHERVICRFFSVEGTRIRSAIVPVGSLTMELGVSRTDLQPVLERLTNERLVISINGGDDTGYVLTPLGYWLATQNEHKAGRAVAEAQVLDIITSALHARWTQASRSEKIETVAMQPQYASFLLFMLIGGAVGPEHALRWHHHDIQRTETARLLLCEICASVGWTKGVKLWAKNSELENFARRSQLKQKYGTDFCKEDERKNSVSRLYFNVASSVEGLTPLMMAAQRSLGSEQVVALVSRLENCPWVKDARFATKSAQIRALFGRHLCPPEYRRLLTKSAEAAAKQLTAEAELSQ
jgi:hypothetical protein